MIPFDVVFTKLCYKLNASPENLSFLRSFNDPNEVKYLTHDQVLKQIIDLRHFKMSIEPNKEAYLAIKKINGLNVLGNLQRQLDKHLIEKISTYDYNMYDPFYIEDLS